MYSGGLSNIMTYFDVSSEVTTLGELQSFRCFKFMLG